MPNPYFRFKKFTIFHDKCAMKVTTDSCVFGAWTAKRIKNLSDTNASMLDIGTGTALLSLMIAQKNPDLAVDAVEIDEAAYAQAKDNIKAAAIQHRIGVISADILHFRLQKQYDFIVCNPPFYENELRSPDATKNIAHHDRGLLLDELLPLIRAALVPSGQFFLLFPYKRKAEIDYLFIQHGLTITHELLVRASEAHPYSRVCYQGKPMPGDQHETETLSIRDTSGAYTASFVALLKDYYLYL
jgi:tRNA1Val (adenine37-N6)-methyltransferase